jgi:hypothetical protein
MNFVSFKSQFHFSRYERNGHREEPVSRRRSRLKYRSRRRATSVFRGSLFPSKGRKAFWFCPDRVNRSLIGTICTPRVPS